VDSRLSCGFWLLFGVFWCRRCLQFVVESCFVAFIRIAWVHLLFVVRWDRLFCCSFYVFRLVQGGLWYLIFGSVISWGGYQNWWHLSFLRAFWFGNLGLLWQIGNSAVICWDTAFLCIPLYCGEDSSFILVGRVSISYLELINCFCCPVWFFAHIVLLLL
jgi:hypothetical protein